MSLSGPFINAKTQELPGAPPGALERAPGPHAIRRSVRFAHAAFMDSKFLALTRRTNTKFVLTGQIKISSLNLCMVQGCESSSFQLLISSFFENFLVPKFQLFLLFSAYFWHFYPISFHTVFPRFFFFFFWSVGSHTSDGTYNIAWICSWL